MLTVNKPETIYIKFRGELPRMFELFDCKNNRVYFQRYLDGKTPRIKFNIPNIGRYKTANNFEILKRVDIEIPKLDFSLPPFERDRIKDSTIIFNPDLANTPARIFTNEGVIEKGRDFYKYPFPIRVFFLLHEYGHFYYKTEMYCDLFALVNFLQMGYNMSTAIYALTNVLRRTPENKERILYIYNHLFKNKK